MIYFLTIKDFYRNIELDKVILIRSERNSSDSLTKVRNQSALIYSIKFCLRFHPILQWVIQNNN